MIAEAWKVFDLPAPRSTGVCKGCCMDPRIELDFLKHSARDLPEAYIRDWYFAAVDEDLGYAQMGWLMPRIMEGLANDGEMFFYGEETALSRLPDSGFPDGWPPRAVDCITAFAHAWFAVRIEANTQLLDETLCTIANAGLPVSPFLDRLAALDDTRLARLLHRNWCEFWQGTIYQTAFWNEQAKRTETWDWYVSEEIENRMILAGLDGDDLALAVAEVIGTTLRG